MTVCIIPMPDKFRTIPKKLQPGHPPIFTDCGQGGPSIEDKALARELFRALDAESQDWYSRGVGGLFADIKKVKRRPRK
jgi:hypothetical protein